MMALAESLNRQALDLFESKRYLEAANVLLEAVRHLPNLPALVANLATALYRGGLFEPARLSCDEVLKLDPDNVEIRFLRAMILLRTGNYEAGWEEYEWRWKHWTKSADPFPDRKRWDGSRTPVLVVFVEQAPGDAFQFLRFLRLARERVDRLVFWTAVEIGDLVRTVSGIDQVAMTRSDLPDKYEVIALASLPRVLATRVDTIPADVPYVLADPAKVQGWAARFDRGLVNVGVAWCGNPKNPIAQERDVPVSYFESLARIPGVKLHNVNPAVKDVPAGFGNCGPLLTDFGQTAAALSHLDLLIACDTSVVHLAGALARPVWTVLAFVPDWRWLTRRESTPWYPTMRLFWQQREGDWGEVFGRVEPALREFVAGAVERRKSE